MRITTFGLRTQILAMFASTTLVGVGCGGSTDTEGNGTGGASTGGTGGSGATGATGGSGATGGYGAGGAGGYGAGGAGGSTGGAAGAGATGGAGGATGGAAGQGGAGGEGGLIIQGTVDCQACTNWMSCWKQGEVPTLPGDPGGTACPNGSYVDMSSYPYCNGAAWLAGDAVEENGLCCYSTNTCVVGRPLVVDGEIRMAPSVLRTDWTRDLELDDKSLDDISRARLTEEWLKDGRLEHASVAAFARLTLELMALGAPPELVRGAQESSLDEIEHAELCFGIAARLSGRAMGPGNMPVHGALGEISLADMAKATFEEGCVGETIAALVAAAQARAARSGSLARVIERIAEDESRHAAFAWRVVRWAIAVGGRSVASVIEKSFERIMTTSAVPASTGVGQDRSVLRAFGRIDGDEAARIRAEALRDVIAPCVRALLAESKAAAA